MEAEFDAFPDRQMKQARVADGFASFAMIDELLAEAKTRLAFTITRDSAVSILERGISTAGG